VNRPIYIGVSESSQWVNRPSEWIDRPRLFTHIFFLLWTTADNKLTNWEAIRNIPNQNKDHCCPLSILRQILHPGPTDSIDCWSCCHSEIRPVVDAAHLVCRWFVPAYSLTARPIGWMEAKCGASFAVSKKSRQINYIIMEIFFFRYKN